MGKLTKKDFTTDSDHDGLTDAEERVYGSDPLNPDTNGNGVLDGDEVKMGLDPTLKFKHKLNDFFIPHEGNNYTPHILKPKRLVFYGLSSVLVKVILITFISVYPLTAWLQPESLQQEIQKIIQLTNQLRISLGVKPLMENRILDQAANKKANDMVTNQYFAHVSPTGISLGDWLSKVSYNYQTAGENLALGFPNAEETMKGWINSPSHYANLVDPGYEEIGIAMVNDKFKGTGTTLAVQFFGQPAASAVSDNITNQPKQVVSKNKTIAKATNKTQPKKEVLQLKIEKTENNTNTAINSEVTPLKAPFLSQYQFKKNNILPEVKTVTSLGTIYLLVILFIAFIALILHICVKVKIQKPKSIIMSLIFIVVMSFLIYL